MQLSFLPNHSSPVNGSIHCSLVDRLEQSGLIDTREDKASLIIASGRSMEVRMQNAGKGDQMEVKKPLSSGSEPLHGKCSPLRSSHRDMIRDLEHRLYRIYLVRNIGHLRLKSMRISSCFFSTCENMRISPIPSSKIC